MTVPRRMICWLSAAFEDLALASAAFAGALSAEVEEYIWVDEVEMVVKKLVVGELVVMLCNSDVDNDDDDDDSEVDPSSRVTLDGTVIGGCACSLRELVNKGVGVAEENDVVGVVEDAEVIVRKLGPATEEVVSVGDGRIPESTEKFRARFFRKKKYSGK